MSEIRIRPRSSIADPELARAAVVDLPTSFVAPHPHVPRAIVRTLAALRRPAEPDRVIVLNLAPVPVRARR